jgi:V8-like Glu-specific endopeptidase
MPSLQKYRVTLVSGLITLLLAACGRQEQSATTAIIGEDERQAVTDPLLLATVGALNLGGKVVCTAFAISETEIMTAAHCLDQAAPIDVYRFHTVIGGFRSLAQISYVNPESDVAFLQTKLRNAQYLPLVTDEALPKSPSLVGFDLKKLKILTTSKGTMSVTTSGVITHTFDSLPGHSGGPIVENGRALGIHVGHSPKLKRNIAVSPKALKSVNLKSVVPDFRSETSVVSALDKMIDACSRSYLCRSAAERLAQRVVDVFIDFVVKFLDRTFTYILEKVPEAKPKEVFHRDPTDRYDPSNRSPGGWAGGDMRDRPMKEVDVIALTSNPAEFNRQVGLSLAGAINLIFQLGLGREASESDFESHVGHINNGASYGFLKAVSLPIASFTKNGNNGTVSCNQFCGGRDWAGGVGSCVRAHAPSLGTISCSSSPGELHGEQLTCECLQDGFSKPGNNGTVSCQQFCLGDIWGEVGNCLAAYETDTGRSLSCETSSGRPQDCSCGGFRTH